MKKFRQFLFFSLLVATQTIFAQREISGTVTDEKGGPLIGAAVFLSGTTSGTVTDLNGAFQLKLPADATKITVSYTGYAAMDIEIGAESQLTIALEPGIILSETVVMALGIPRSEKSLGYAVSQIEGEEMAKVRDPNIVNQFAGRAAGVTVIGSSGNLGSSARITIRGIKSINGNNQPLFVVDGVPMDNSNFTNKNQIEGARAYLNESGYDYGSAIQDINPADIETVSVLKGQSAASLYGSRGANGVVLITTKKGRQQAKGVGISVSSSLIFDNVAYLPKYQNKYGGGVELRPYGYNDNSGYYKVAVDELDEDGNIVSSFQSFDLVPNYAVDESFGTRFAKGTDEHFQGLESSGFAFPNGYGTNEDHLMFRDWNSWDSWDTDHFGLSRAWEPNGNNPKEFYETGVSSNQNIAFEGGGQGSAFRLAYNRYDQKGIYPNSKMGRNTVSFNGESDMGKHMSAFIGVNYVNSRTTGRAGTSYDNSGGISPGQNFNQWFHRELRFEDLKSYENPDGSQRTWNRRSVDDPFPQYWDNVYWTRYKNYQNDGRDRVYGNAGLTYEINDWLSATGRVLTDFYNERREDRIAVGSLATSQYSLDQINVSETNMDLILKANSNISKDITFSAFVGGNKLWRTTKRTIGSTRGGLSVPDIYQLQNSIERPIIQNYLYEKEIESIFGGLTFGWRDLIYLDLTGRNDWSSTLPEENNSYFYPSASMSFVFSEMIQSDILSFGKLRLGWAKAGNDTDPYNVFDVYSPNDNFGDLPAYTVPDVLNNRNLSSEQTTSIEIGTDLRFIEDRFGIDFTLYSSSTTNQIIPLGTTPASGYTQQFINAGEITNKGMEIELYATPVKTRNFRWELGFNFGKNTNEIVELNADDPSLTNIELADAIFGGTLNAFEGKPYGTLLGTDYLRDNAGNRLIDPATGLYLVSTDLVPIGNTTPDFTGGLTNTFSWKGLSLNVLVDFRKGGDIWSVSNLWGKYSGLFEETAEGDIRENGIVPEGILATVDADGLPILEDEGDPNVVGDEVYASSGQANTIAVDAQTYFYLNGGNVLQAADVYDGSFIKLREMSLSYALPKSWFGKSGIRDASLSLIGRNLAILHKNIPHLDPDNAISTNNVQGLEGGQAASTRSIGMSLNFRF